MQNGWLQRKEVSAREWRESGWSGGQQWGSEHVQRGMGRHGLDVQRGKEET